MSASLQIDLDVILPDAHDSDDQCVAALITSLGSIDGVESVHVLNDAGGATTGGARVCLHVATGSVSTRTLRARAEAAGAAIERRYGHLVTRVSGVGNTSRAAALTRKAQTIPGVVDAVVTVEGVVRVEYELKAISEADVLSALQDMGLKPPTRQEPHDHEHGRVEGGHEHGHGASRIELGAALLSLVVYVVARGLDWFSDLDTSVTILYVAAAAVTGVFVARDAWLSMRSRVFDIDQLMLIAAVGAATIGHWSDSALLLVLFSLGHALEGYAMNRARNAIEALGELAPATARRKDTPDLEVPVVELVVGDVIVVRPNERIPADGVIISGDTSIDESPVTGESVPVDKTAIDDPATALDGIDNVPSVHRTFAGTLNGPGAVDILVLRVAADSTLARVVQLVAEAETQISPTQRLTKRIVRVFVPSVLALVGLLLVAPPLLGEAFTDSFARAMAVLVAASPCALAIATPSAVLAAIGRAARAGILVKGGGPLEALGTVDAVAFDKTGTLTEGRPVLTDIEPAEPGLREAMLVTALAVERLSDHPIARAITTGLDGQLGDQTVPDADEVEAVNGKGIVATVEGDKVMIGNLALFDGVSVPTEIRSTVAELELAGRTTIVIRRGERVLGVLGVMDTPREDAEWAVQAMRDLGVATVVMLSGDNQRVATAVGAHVGVRDARGGLLPTDKVDAITSLANDGGVAMVGDGVNDAPALAAADVGIAMGAAGSDVALETADIALLADRLDGLPTAVGLARRASSTIKQNLFFSLGVVALLIPLTIAGVGISFAVIAHEGSTLVVVGNALRLLNYRSDTRAERSDRYTG